MKLKFTRKLEYLNEKFVKSFLRRNPMRLLLAGIIISSIELVLLLISAKVDGTWRIKGGIGILDHYAVFSFLVGDIAILYLLRKYIDSIYLFKEKVDLSAKQKIIVARRFKSFRSSLLLKNSQALFCYVGFVSVGFIFWLNNMFDHVTGNTVEQWGRLTFDAFEFKAGFYCTRLHLFISWVVLLPYFAFVASIVTTEFLKTISDMEKEDGYLPFDLLHNDKCGGYSFIGDAYVYFNFILTICYIEAGLVVYITAGITIEQIMILSLLTAILVFGNFLLLKGTRNAIQRARMICLEDYKSNLGTSTRGFSFDVYKYGVNEVVYNPFSGHANRVIYTSQAIAILVTNGFQFEKFISGP